MVGFKEEGRGKGRGGGGREGGEGGLGGCGGHYSKILAKYLSCLSVSFIFILFTNDNNKKNVY